MVAQQGGTWLADSPSASAIVLDTLDAIGVRGAIEEHFGERPYFSLQKSTLRRSLPRHKMVAWHQDGSFLGGDVRTMNVWVALSPCGGDRPSPGLELVPRRFDEILPVVGIPTPHSVDFDLVDELTRELPTTIPSLRARRRPHLRRAVPAPHAPHARHDRDPLRPRVLVLRAVPPGRRLHTPPRLVDRLAAHAASCSPSGVDGGASTKGQISSAMRRQLPVAPSSPSTA